MKYLVFLLLVSTCWRLCSTCSCVYSGPDPTVTDTPQQISAICTSGTSLVTCLQSSVDPACSTLRAATLALNAQLQCSSSVAIRSTLLPLTIAVIIARILA